MPVEPLRPGEITVTAEDGDTVFLSPIFDGVLEWAREIFLASFGPPGLEASLRVGAFIQLLATFAITHDDPDEIADFAEYLLEHLTVPSRIEDLLLPNDKLLAAAKQTPVLISREKSYTVEWTGGDTETDVAYILGFAPGESSVGAFLCSADADAGTFEVPRRALANMPATPADREGFLAVGVVRKLSERTEASVEGLDRLTISEDISIATGARFN